MTIGRRRFLGGAGAMLAVGRVRAAEPVLDRAASLPPAEGLALLEGARSADAAEALDLGAARAGLAIDAALASDPGARERFVLLMRRASGAADADTLRRRLARERERLDARAGALFDRLGVRGTTTGERFTRAWQDERFLYADDAGGRARAVADMNRSLAAARGRVSAAFGAVPPEWLDVSVRAVTPAELAAGRGGYREVPSSGRAGAYAVDLGEVRRRPSWTLPAVVAHELLPGHMVQLPIEGRRPPHPLRRRYAAAFAEGWAVYAEGLAMRQGGYAGPWDELGHVHWLLFRACRGLADIGLHLDGWSPSDALARLAAWQGEPAYFAPFDRDLERMAREPGLRAGEAASWLAIADGAGSRSGAALVRYHRAVLAHGAKRTEQVAAVR